MQESSFHVFLAQAKSFLLGFKAHSTFPVLDTAVEALIRFSEKTHENQSAAVESLVSHLRAIRHYIKVKEGKSLYLRAIHSSELDKLITEGEAILGASPFCWGGDFKPPAKATIIKRKDDRVREKKLEQEQSHLDDNPLFHNLLRSIWLYALEKGFVSKTIFISYAWPIGDTHEEAWTKSFVEKLAYHLVSAGFQVYLDDIQGGAGFPLDEFMSKLKKCDHVFLISSRTMQQKLKIQASGVNQEKRKIIEHLEHQDTSFRERIVIPILLNYQNYCDPMFASLAEVPMCVDGYLGSLCKLLPRLFGDSKEQFEKWFDRQLKSEQLSCFEGVPHYPFVSLVRENLLVDIQARFDAKHRVKHPKVVLYGEQGSGKTDVAVQFCHRPQTKLAYQKIYWVSASASDLKEVIEKADEKPNCLLVIDGVTDFDLISSLLPQEVDVLITSEKKLNNVDPVVVPYFTPQEAAEAVRKALGNREIDRLEYINALIDLVGCSPVALSQAVSEIARDRLNIPRFLLLKKNRKFADAMIQLELLDPLTVKPESKMAYESVSVSSDSVGSPLLFKPSERVRAWGLPRPQNPHFTGRVELLNKLKSCLNFHALDNQKPVVVITCEGIGGVGKTELALEYVYSQIEHYRFVIWISAESTEKIQSEFIKLAKYLGVVTENMPIDKIIATVKSRLCTQAGNLLIFDNAPNYTIIQPFIPPSGNAVLVSSRTPAGQWPQKPLSVREFSPEEAREYVLAALGYRVTESVEVVDRLCRTVKNLPLPLAQAVAYIWTQEISIPEYLGRFEEEPVALLQSKEMPVFDKHVPVYTTVELARKAVARQSPTVGRLLKICALLDSEGFPGFTLWVELTQKGWDDISWLFKAFTITFEETLGLLSQYGLIRIDDNYRVYMHQVVAQVIRSRIKPNKIPIYIDFIYQMLYQNFPFGVNKLRDITLRRVMLPHIEALLPRVEGDAEKTASLLERVAMVYQDSGFFVKASQLQQRVVALRGGLDTSDVDDDISGLLHLSNLEGKRGNIDEQNRLLTDVMRRLENHEGGAEQHPKFPVILCNFGVMFLTLASKSESTIERQQLSEKAINNLKRAVVLYKDEVGSRLNLARAKINLAEAYSFLDRPKNIFKLLDEAAQIFVEEYGDTPHPEVAQLFLMYAKIWLQRGQFNQQCEYLKKAKEISVRYYKTEEHPAVAEIFFHLATSYAAQSDIEEAIAHCTKAWTILSSHPEGTGGPYDKRLATTRQFLDELQSGKYGSKRKSEGVKDRERRWKKVQVLNAEGLITYQCGKYGKARDLFRECLDLYAVDALSLGGDADELNVIDQIKYNLGSAYCQQHDCWRAHRNLNASLQASRERQEFGFFQRVQSRLAEVDVLNLIQNYGCNENPSVYWDQLSVAKKNALKHYKEKEYAKAIHEFESYLRLYCFQLEPDPEVVASTYYNLGSAYWRNKNYYMALACLDQALMIRRQCHDQENTEKTQRRMDEVKDDAKSDELSKVRTSVLQLEFVADECCEKLKMFKQQLRFFQLEKDGIEKQREGDYAKAIELFEICLEIYEANSLAREDHLYCICFNLGTCYVQVNSFEPALGCFLRAQELKRKTQDDEGVEEVQKQLDAIYHLKYVEKQRLNEVRRLELMEKLWEKADQCHEDANYPKAIRCYKAYLMLCESQENVDKEQVALACDNLGNSFFAVQHYEQTFYYLSRALLLWIELDDEENIQDVKQRLADLEPYLRDQKIKKLGEEGVSCYKSERYRDAILLFEECITLLRLQTNLDQAKYATTYFNLGSAYWRIGNYEQAIYHLTIALPIRSMLGDVKGAKNIETRLAEIKKERDAQVSPTTTHFGSARAFLPPPAHDEATHATNFQRESPRHK